MKEYLLNLNELDKIIVNNNKKKSENDMSF